ncbi:hypothetical protein [Streptomyces sp. NPDC001594]|uniref:hypothetical protein n=1 Tax=Streptomyces sp. NPDC001594 TaxID=3364590 RepID=UPI0036A1D24B
MTAHPPRVRWHVETYDPLAREWVSGLPLTNSQAAVEQLAHLTETRPAWRDGTPCSRRIVVETTTYEDLTAEPADRIAKFPRAGFILPGLDGQDLAAFPGRTPDGRPAIRFSAGSSETGHAEAFIPVELLEEVIAGQREAARQAGGQPFAPTRRRLTELEHDRAWHAIEGTAGEDSADPGTVLAGVLRVLDIDPPASPEPCAQQPGAGALCGHCGIPKGSHHHPWTSTAEAILGAPHNAAKETGA